MVVFAAAAAAVLLPAAGAYATGERDPGSERVCFAEKTTGSHIRKRVCMTKAEREKRMRENQEAMKRLASGKQQGASGRDSATP